MEIELNDGIEALLLRWNGTSFELCYLRPEKDKETGEVTYTWTATYWFSKLEHALSFILKTKLGNKDIKTLVELKEELQVIKTDLIKYLSSEITASAKPIQKTATQQEETFLEEDETEEMTTVIRRRGRPRKVLA